MERLLYNGTKKLPEIFSEEEINSILMKLMLSENYPKTDFGKWMKVRDVCLIATIYILGLRPKEACCLKFTDFNLNTMMVKIRGSSNKVRKDRWIPIPKTLFKFYKQYLNFPKYRFWRGSKYLFPSMESNHISPERLKCIFREKVLKPMKLWNCSQASRAEYRTLYKLRHSRASHILEKQIKKHGQPDLYAIANFLGHSDLRSTQVYLHTDKNYQEYLRGEIEI